MEKNMKCLLSIVCLTFCLHLSQAQSFSSYATTCSNCNSTTSANCESSQGVALCTCKPGFIGDGLNCTRMSFCDTQKCCPDGYTWDVKAKQCTDIDECKNPALKKCTPADTCINRNGIHLCTFNKNPKCGGDKCDDDEDCLTVNGVDQCADPCNNYNTINGTSRLYTITSTGRFDYDRNSIGWYRFVGKGLSIREGCVATQKCSSFQPYSLGDKHPDHGDGIIIVPLLSNTATLGCVRGAGVPVKACPKGYYVYKLPGLLRFDVYCTDTVTINPATTTTPTTTTTTTPTTTTTTTPTTTTTTPTTTTTTPTTTTTTPTTTTTTPTTTTTTPTTTTTTPTTTTTTPTTTTTTPTTTSTTPTTTTTTPTTTTTTPTTTTTTPTTTTTTPTTTTPTTTTTTPTTTTTTPTTTTTTPTTTTPTTTTTTPTTTTTTTPTTTTTTPTTTTPTTTTTTPTTTTTTTTPSTTKTSPTTTTPARTLSPAAAELLQVLQKLQALAESMADYLPVSERNWITNKVAELTPQINDMSPSAITAALSNFASELIPAAHNFLSSQFQ